MSKPKLTYFDAPVSRGEECRLALTCAGVDFEDVRVKSADWPALKPTTPFGSMPILELPGHPPLAQSHAVLVYIGRRWGIHPKDDFEAARHEAIISHVEDLRHQIAPTMRIKDEAEKKAARENIAANVIPVWAGFTEKQISNDGPFLSGSQLMVADIKLHMIVRWIKGGALDHLPKTAFDAFPKLIRVHDAVRDDARVKAWTAKHH
jgi:glutathione S-transferase